jgi:hypothetical protein
VTWSSIRLADACSFKAPNIFLRCWWLLCYVELTLSLYRHCCWHASRFRRPPSLLRFRDFSYSEVPRFFSFCDSVDFSPSEIPRFFFFWDCEIFLLLRFPQFRSFWDSEVSPRFRDFACCESLVCYQIPPEVGEISKFCLFRNSEILRFQDFMIFFFRDFESFLISRFWNFWWILIPRGSLIMRLTLVWETKRPQGISFPF